MVSVVHRICIACGMRKLIPHAKPEMKKICYTSVSLVINIIDPELLNFLFLP